MKNTVLSLEKKRAMQNTKCLVITCGYFGRNYRSIGNSPVKVMDVHVRARYKSNPVYYLVILGCFMRLKSVVTSLVLYFASSPELSCNMSSRFGSTLSEQDPSCYVECFGFCNGYFRNNFGYYNPNCANVCCPW